MLSPMYAWRTKDEENEIGIQSVRISKDNSLIACGLSNGQVGLYSATTGRLSYSLDQSPEKLPITSVRFHPTLTKQFLAASSDGYISCWTTHNPKTLWTTTEKNEIYAMDVQPSGDLFATAGLDKTVRIYDFETQKIKSELRYHEYQDEILPGHTNRIFSLIFNPSDPNILVSGGWDDTLQVWDIRMKQSIRSMFGAHVCGDSLDIYKNTILSGSWLTKEQLQFWDMRSFTLTRTIKVGKKTNQCLVYAAKFHPSGKYVIAGGSGSNDVWSFNVETSKQVGKQITLNSSVFSLCMTDDGRNLLVGTVKGELQCNSIS